MLYSCKFGFLLCFFLLYFSWVGSSRPSPQTSLPDINFAPGSSRLSPHSMEILDAYARFIRPSPDYRLVMEGHCDDVEAPVHAHALSLQRAEAAKAYLASKGVPVCRLETRGFGSTLPSVTNTVGGKRNISNMVFNRRVSFRFEYVEYELLTSRFVGVDTLVLCHTDANGVINEESLAALNRLNRAIPALLKSGDSIKVHIDCRKMDGDKYRQLCPTTQVGQIDYGENSG